ncbi:hypothetical protein OBV_04410 [Oscillibacter valericigenes Sjm18-20]|nr:hypothetical protein OBV_04410 [Oscillibacter valericigenes Sjm18-20]
MKSGHRLGELLVLALLAVSVYGYLAIRPSCAVQLYATAAGTTAESASAGSELATIKTPESTIAAEKNGEESELPEDTPIPQEALKQSVGEQPPEFLKLLGMAGREPEALTAGQLVVAAADGTDAAIYAFQKGDDAIWTLVLDGASGHVGKKGVTADKAEGDLKTPLGLYSIPFSSGFKETRAAS